MRNEWSSYALPFSRSRYRGGSCPDDLETRKAQIGRSRYGAVVFHMTAAITIDGAAQTALRAAFRGRKTGTRGLVIVLASSLTKVMTLMNNITPLWKLLWHSDRRADGRCATLIVKRLLFPGSALRGWPKTIQNKLYFQCSFLFGELLKIVISCSASR